MMLGLLLSLILASVALADIGPKPTMDFVFTALTDVQPEIVEATLYECSDPTCTIAEPLQELGPQRITCQATSCYSMAYGYAEHFRLSVRFSDGITRESNVFGKRAYQAQYTVRIEDSSLVVEEHSTFGSLFNGPLYIVALFTLGAAVLILPLLALLHLVFLGIWIVRAPRPEAPRPEAPPRWLFSATWILSGLGIVIGLIAAFTVPLTLLIELPVLIAYVRWRNKPLRLWLTLGVAVNLVTQPLLWSMAIGGGLSHFPWTTLAIVETGIWLVEAVLLYLPLRRQTTFPAMLLLSLAMNALSFGLGLLLPV
jgi:hypothetical protein